MRKELNCKKRIVLIGTEKEVRDTEKIVLSLDLTWNESVDRLVLQDAIDTYTLRANICYEGNDIVPYKKTLKEFRKYNKQKTLDGLSNYFYNFLLLNCGDTAHHDKYGYINHYDNSFTIVKREVIDNATSPRWKTDLIRVFKAIKNK